jgi:L-arginine dehydrogenase
MSGTAPQRSEIAILRQSDFNAHLPERDVLKSLRTAFESLGKGTAVQPPQAYGLVDGHLDVIWYPAILAAQNVFGAKLSPYFFQRTDGGPKVTAWTILFSASTGEPVLLCDSLALTTERTAATTALAVQLLLPANASRLLVVGAGNVGLAHVRYASAINNWSQIQIFSRTLKQKSAPLESLPQSLKNRIAIADSLQAAVEKSDVILLCTSSGTPVIDAAWLKPTQLVTSISTNVPNAHEISPAALPHLDVYCDYRPNAPLAAGEMKLAAANHNWDPKQIRADLPELVTARGQKPSGAKPIFFRSIGLGIEDLAIACELLAQTNNASAKKGN